MAKRRNKWEDMLRISAKERLINQLRYSSEDPKDTWNAFATAHAKYRYENDMATHRGSYVVSDLPTGCGRAFCLFDNRPYTNVDGGSSRREKLLELFREKMRAAGITELGYGTYPAPGCKQAGYTFAIMLDADESGTDLIVDGFHQSVRETDEWHAKESRYQEQGDSSLDIDSEGDNGDDSGNDTSSIPNVVNVGTASQFRQVRVGQSIFSRAVRRNFGHRCASKRRTATIPYPC